MILGYIRISSDKQFMDNQKHALLEWSQRNKVIIDEFIEIEASTRKTKSERKLDQVLEKLSDGDELVATELSTGNKNS